MKFIYLFVGKRNRVRKKKCHRKPPEKFSVIVTIYKYFEAESKRKALFYGWNKVSDRTCHALGISRSLLYSCVKNSDAKHEPGRAEIKKTKKDSLDGFSKYLIKREVLTLLDINVNITVEYKVHVRESL